MNIELIYEDKRGKIYRLSMESKEYLIIETKAGFARGGDTHQCAQYETVLKGSISCEEYIDRKDIETTLHEGDSKTIGANIPHMFTSITDSLIIEWLDGNYERIYYQPYRKRVEELNK